MDGNGLENYYSGDAAWNRFASLYADIWEANPITDALCKALNGHVDIAKVIYGKFGSDAMSLLSRPIPALENLPVVACTREPNLVRRLKECLMRMP